MLGFGVVRWTAGEPLDYVACGVVATASSQSLPHRLHRLYRELGLVIDTYGVTELAVEQVFFQRNVRTAFAVGQARGVVLLAAAERNLPVAEYTPLEVKQAVTSYGRASKSQVQEMVRLLLGLDAPPRPDDAADALALAICHARRCEQADLMRRAGRC